MNYRVTHKTKYTYGESVPLCHNALHLRPRSTPRQVCHSCDLHITPYPPVLSERKDFFGNPVTFFSLEEPHVSLKIETVSRVEVFPARNPQTFWSTPWEQVPGQLRQNRQSQSLEAWQFVYDSPRVYRSAALAAYARPSFPPGRPLLECVDDLTRRIHAEFKFDSSATSVVTPISEVLVMRRGVCQDFAHLQIGCLRSMGLPARYVSGYLLTDPPPGQERLAGADASHAWVSVYCPDYGWVDFDPTNGLLPSEQHVTVAWGRDYDDVCPVKGVLIGGREHTLAVSVDVVPVEV